MNARSPVPRSTNARSRAWLERTDQELVALARSAGALRLALGNGLSLLRRTAGVADLGFPHLGAYAFERLGRKRHWAEDTARVAERLAELPLIRAALADGQVAWSMAELLARQATAESEAELLAAARAMTVRAMRAQFAAAKVDPESSEGEPASEIEPDDVRCTMQVTVSRLTAWAYELTRRRLRAEIGTSSDDAVVEALLAEALVTLLQRHPGLKPGLDACARADVWDQRRELERRLAEITAEDAFHRGAVDPELAALVADALSHADEAPPPRDAVALDAHLRTVNTRLQQRDRRLGELALRFWEADAWHHLGYASATQYAHERLGCSLAAIKARMTLARRCRPLPEVAVALVDGTIGFEAARLVSRVAGPDTVQAWLDRAACRTVKHLQEEIEAVESIATADGCRPDSLAPPDDDTMAAYIDLERAVLDGTVADLLAHGGQLSGQMSGAAIELEQAAVNETVAAVLVRSGQISGATPELEQAAVNEAVAAVLVRSGQISGATPELEQAVVDEAVAAVLVRSGQLSGGDRTESMPGSAVDQPPSQMSGDGPGVEHAQDAKDAKPPRRGVGRVPLRLRLPADLVAFWRDVEALFRSAGEPGEFADFLIRTFWHTWLLVDPGKTEVAYDDVYARECFRCASPVCNNRDLTPHHLRFRSRGGGEERANLLGLCTRCHLELVHQGLLRAEPPAHDVRWTFGRAGLLTVHGRTRVRETELRARAESQPSV